MNESLRDEKNNSSRGERSVAYRKSVAGGEMR